MSDNSIDLKWLASEAGQIAIKQAAAYDDAFAAVTNLRKQNPDIAPDLISQAITQAKLRSSLLARWKTDVSRFLLTQDGIHQATRPAVANWRAELIVREFGTGARVLDLTCGLGFDALAMAKAGLNVRAIELDPITVDCARHNLLGTDAIVDQGDATRMQISGADVIFIDPMRRDPNGARSIDGATARISNPDNWSPSWSFIEELAEQHKVICKVAPGISDEYLGTWNTSWVSHDGDLVEAMAVSGGSGKKQAVVLGQSQVLVIEGVGPARVSSVGRFLVVPDSAITRADAIDALAEKVCGGLVNEHIGWITTDSQQEISNLLASKPKLADVFEIVATTKAVTKSISQAIRDIPASAVTIMTRGIQIDVEQMRKQVAPKLTKSAPELVVALYRDDSGNKGLICRRIAG